MEKREISERDLNIREEKFSVLHVSQVLFMAAGEAELEELFTSSAGAHLAPAPPPRPEGAVVVMLPGVGLPEQSMASHHRKQGNRAWPPRP